MLHVNVSRPDITFDPDDPEGFRSGRQRVRTEGEGRTGTSIYELPPGQAICPYHYELAEEEWVVVIEGRPTLRTPEGEQQLEPLDMVFFPTGPEGAHRVTNTTESTVRVLMFSEIVFPAATVYPDSDKVGLFTADRSDDLLVRRSSGVDYFDGEV